jgi:hypothetical protein
MLKIRWTPSREYESYKCKMWVTALYIIERKKIISMLDCIFYILFHPRSTCVKLKQLTHISICTLQTIPENKFNFSFVQYCYLSIIDIRFISFRLSQASVVFLSVYLRYTRGIIAYKQYLYLSIPIFFSCNNVLLQNLSSFIVFVF